jgi:hypothetical protein
MLPLLFALIVAPPSPPPAPASAFAAPIIVGSGSRIPLPASDMAIEIRAKGDLLWAGSLHVNGDSTAMFNQQKADAPKTECALSEPEYTGTSRSSLMVTLRAIRYGQDKSGYQLSVTWEHPTGSLGCEGERGSRTVGLQQSFRLDPEQETTISADGGLTANIRRHSN